MPDKLTPEPRPPRLTWGKRLRDLIGLHEHEWEVTRTGGMKVYVGMFNVIPAIFRVEKCRCGKETAWITELAGERKDVPYSVDPQQIRHR